MTVYSHSMKFQEAQDYALARLEKDLPDTVYYHCYEHTVDVMEAAERLGRYESLPETDLQLLKTAAAFHDIGFVNVYQNHEENGCVIVREVLPGLGFEAEQVEQVCAMIMATKVPQEPQDRLGQLICDADLDYLGRDDFYKIGNRLFKELKGKGILETEEAWNRLQVKFLSVHQYFTEFSKQNREPKKQAYLHELKELVESYQ